MGFATEVSDYIIKQIGSVSSHDFGGHGSASFFEYLAVALITFVAIRLALHYTHFGILSLGVEVGQKNRKQPYAPVFLMSVGVAFLLLFGVLPYYAYVSVTPVWDEHFYHIWQSFHRILGDW
ncbi:MAG: hypothetical protein U9N57_14160 [Pseudomonadota bacterium]|nr:hypothetical protein [Pseudomonadota bacterium]